MGVIASLLPGLRELRAPLTAGYLYLLAAWLLLNEWVPHARPEVGSFASLWDLGGIVGRAVIFAAVTFAAYMIGSFAEIDPQNLVGRGGLVRYPSLSRYRVLYYVAQPIFRVLNYIVQSFLASPPLSPSARADFQQLETARQIPADYSDLAISEFMEEMPQLATRLQIKNAEIYSKYDRLVAEGTFRLNAAVPLTLFLALLAVGTDLRWWWKALLFAAVFLFGLTLARQGMRRVVAARDVLVQALSIPDLGLESRRLSDLSWRSDRLRLVGARAYNMAALGRSDPGIQAMMDMMRRQDIREGLGRFYRYSSKTSDDDLLKLLPDLFAAIQHDLAEGIRRDPHTIYTIDLLLRRFDEAHAAASSAGLQVPAQQPAPE